MDRTTILTQARAALTIPIQTPVTPQFHSELEANPTTAGAFAAPPLQRTQADALQSFCAAVAALTAGYLLTHDDVYTQRALAHLRPWLLALGTALQPEFDQAGCAPETHQGTPAGVVDLVPLAELARALCFLADSLPPDDVAALQTWCAGLQRWLNDAHSAMIAREAKDHRGSAWLLLSASIARWLRDEKALEDCRKRFRMHTLRQQIRSDGVFPQEVATPNPYRNTLFNFDLLGGSCQLLSSQFDLLWDYELIDGVGLRSVAAYLFPVIAHPERWGYPADARFFRDLPGRRPAMLFAGRAYNRPEYVALWQGLPSTIPQEIASSFPIRQPMLWTTRAPHGF